MFRLLCRVLPINLTRQNIVPKSQNAFVLGSRSYCEGQADATEGEKKITSVLKEKFPGATYTNVADISGGCGSMYEIQMEAEEFRGKRTVLQHRMVNEALKEEIANMHGLRISTAVPEAKS